VNILPNAADEERPEPFATISELIGEHGIEEVLQSLSDHALFDSENLEACSCCSDKAAKIHWILHAILSPIKSAPETVRS
jgi:hypothetical protein